MRFDGKNVLVTGGSNGIGKSIAVHMAKLGANIIIVYRSDKSGADEVVAEALEHGVQAHSIQADIGKREDLFNIVPQALEIVEQIDILVNNAGICPFREIFDVTEEIFERTMDVNVKGYFFMAQQVAKHMVDKGIKGRIINVSSVSGMLGSATQIHYCTTKGGINAMTKALAVALGKYDITVNAVLPATIPSNANIDQLADEATMKFLIDATPLGRLGEGRHVAAAVAYLASDDSDWTTGTLLVVDGGYIA